MANIASFIVLLVLEGMNFSKVSDSTGKLRDFSDSFFSGNYSSKADYLHCTVRDQGKELSDFQDNHLFSRNSAEKPMFLVKHWSNASSHPELIPPTVATIVTFQGQPRDVLDQNE